MNATEITCPDGFTENGLRFWFDCQGGREVAIVLHGDKIDLELWDGNRPVASASDRPATQELVDQIAMEITAADSLGDRVCPVAAMFKAESALGISSDY